MSKGKTTLKEFIQWIPTRSQDCELEIIALEIARCPQKKIALVNSENIPQGIIYSDRLMNLLATELSSRQNSWHNFASIPLLQAKVTLPTLSGDLTVEDFLGSFATEETQPKRDYFIVDKSQKLLGILNKAQLLQELCNFSRKKANNNFLERCEFSSNQGVKQDFIGEPKDRQTTLLSKNYGKKIKINNIPNLEQKKSKLFSKDSSLFNLLQQISLPISIEDNRGEICYQNDRWNREINSNQKKYHTPIIDDENVGSLSNREQTLEQITINNNQKKYASRSLATDNAGSIVASAIANNSTNSRKLQRKSQSYHCPTIDSLAKLSPSSDRIQQQIDRLNSASYQTKTIPNTTSELAAWQTREYVSDWYYYRVPLEIESDSSEFNNYPNYWLIIATKIPFLPSLTKDYCELQKQTQLKQLQTEFMVNISHDMKSPLTAIIGLSSLLKEEKVGSLNKNQLRHSQMIYQSSKKLLNLINDFLDITRLTSDALELNLESIELKTTCQQIYKRVTEKLIAIAAINKEDNLVFPELQLDIAPNTNKAIADKTYFIQILTRFLETALHSAKAEGLLGIAAEYWSDWLTITVWHEGKGISEVRQDLATVDLTQVNNFLISPDKKQELGLVLAQYLARAHGGDISFISHRDYGSELTLLIPARSSNYANENDSDVSFVATKNINSLILIVETSATKIVDLSEHLKTLGYHCIIARNITEALFKARRFQPPKIIINDSFLADSSIDIVKSLQSDPKIRNISLVISGDFVGFEEKGSLEEVLRDLDGEQTSQKYDNKSIFIAQHYLKGLNSPEQQFISFPITKNALARIFPPIESRQLKRSQSSQQNNLVVLRLSLTEGERQNNENLAIDSVFENLSLSLTHRIIEADSLEQACLLARIWQIDVIIWDGASLESPEFYLDSFAQSEVLARIPIITLDIKSTEAANKLDCLTVFPCLLPTQERSIHQLIQVIQIATGWNN